MPSRIELLYIFELPKTPLDYFNLGFFNNWIVGFTVYEGSFFVKKSNDGCFQLKQILHANLFKAFKLVFNTNPKVTIKVCIINLETVIAFFSYWGHHPLIGLKNIQYLNWLTNLRHSVRYANINIPK